MNDELLTLIELKHFPVQSTRDYFERLPKDCIKEMAKFYNIGSLNHRLQTETLYHMYRIAHDDSHLCRLANFNNALKRTLVQYYKKQTNGS